LPQAEAAAPSPLGESAAAISAPEHATTSETSSNILKIRYTETAPDNNSSDGEPTAENVPAPPAQSAGCQNCPQRCECQTCPIAGEVGFGRIEKSCSNCDETSMCDRIRAMHDSHYPGYYQERPFGTYVRAAAIGQIRNGLADQMVLYRYDFRDGSRAAELSPRGKYQLTKFAMRAFQCGMPILIEETPDTPEVASARRDYVIGALRELDSDFAQPEDLVVVGRPRLPGLNGNEALIIDVNLLQQTQSRGTIGPGYYADPSNTQGSIPTVP
jgi:hypothetical protein